MSAMICAVVIFVLPFGFRRFHIHIPTRYSNARQQETARACDYFGAGPRPERLGRQGLPSLRGLVMPNRLCCITASLIPLVRAWSCFASCSSLGEKRPVELRQRLAKNGPPIYCLEQGATEAVERPMRSTSHASAHEYAKLRSPDIIRIFDGT